VLVVVAGICGGWAATRRTDSLVWWHVVPLAGLVGVGSGLVTAIMVGLASGVAGPGRLADVGASPVYLGGCVAAQTGLGALLVLLATRAEVHAAVAAAWRSVRGRGRAGGDAEVASGAGGAGPRTGEGPGTGAPAEETAGAAPTKGSSTSASSSTSTTSTSTAAPAPTTPPQSVSDDL